MATLAAVNLGTGRTAKSISLGAYFSCAILDNDLIKCWGYNGSGQLGYDDTTTRGATGGSMAALAAVNLGVGRIAKKVAIGAFHTCAILDNGSLKCWGFNNRGQLGLEDTTNRGDTGGSMAALTTLDLGAGRTVTQVSVGDYQGCVVLDNGKLKCWGRNHYGQLGYDDFTSRGNTAGSMATVANVLFP